MISLVHSAHTSGNVTFSGCLAISGNQQINDSGGCPIWIGKILEEHPEIQEIALNIKNTGFGDGGVIYSRIEPLDK